MKVYDEKTLGSRRTQQKATTTQKGKFSRAAALKGNHNSIQNRHAKSLGRREEAVFLLRTGRYTQEQVAVRLQISVRTVKRYVAADRDGRYESPDQLLLF